MSFDQEKTSSSVSSDVLVSSPAQSSKLSMKQQLAVTQKERERLAFAQEVGKIGTFEWDIVQHRISWTPELEALYGLPPGSFEGSYEHWVQRVHPDDRQLAEDNLAQAVQGGPDYNVEFRVIWPDQSVRWLLGKGRVQFDESGKALRVVGVNIDITERKKAELHNAQQAALIQAAYDAFIVHEAGRIVSWNQGASTLYGWSEQEAHGQTIHTLLSTHFPVPLEEIYQTLREKGTWEGELEQTKRDGTPVVVTSRWVLLKQITGPLSSSSTTPRVLEVNRDITDLKRSLQRLRFLTEASKLLVSSFNSQEVLIQIAHLAVPLVADWCRIDLLKDDKTVEPLVITHVDPEKVAWAYELNAKTPYDPDAPTGVPAAIRTKKSEFYPYIPDELLVAAAKDEEELALSRAIGLSSVITVPLVVQNNAVGAITLVTTETKRRFVLDDLAMAEELASRINLALENVQIYERLQRFTTNLEEMVIERTTALEESSAALRQLNTELQRSNQELQEFAYVASHDLQEPLRKIQAFGNLLQEEHGEAIGEGKLYLDRMRNAASRMQILINDLLMFSRVTTKALPFTAVDLNVIARDVVGDLEALIVATQGKVEIGSLPIIDADPLQMRQLLQNLIGNALKFHKPDVLPVVHVSAEMREDEQTGEQQCLLSIQDNGIGFDEKYLDRIFIVFQRLHGRGEYEGTGIGLAVVRKIVERHGGTITAQSAIGEGATFLVTLPTHHASREGITV